MVLERHSSPELSCSSPQTVTTRCWSPPVSHCPLVRHRHDYAPLNTQQNENKYSNANGMYYIYNPPEGVTAAQL